MLLDAAKLSMIASHVICGERQLTYKGEILEWDTENWGRALDFWERFIQPGLQLRCLELGAHHGGLSLWLAEMGHTVVCSDIRDSAERARPLHVRHGVTDRITYQDIDATAIPYENYFDVIAFRSVLGGIAWDGDIQRQETAVASMYRALRPGGVLLFAENLRGSSTHQALRRHLISWHNCWRYVTIDEMRRFLTPFEEIHYQTTGFFGLLGRKPILAHALGKFDGAVCDRIVSPSARYIIYGVAKKGVDVG